MTTAAGKSPLDTPLHQALRGKRVLVTGHTGFKGAWLCLWLHELGAIPVGFAIDIPTKPSLFEMLRLSERMDDRRGDIRDLKALEATVEAVKPDLVVHMAAQSLVRVSYQRPLETFEVNTLGTANLLDAVRRAGRSCSVLAVTSDKCYRPSARPTQHAETDAVGGDDPYSASKACAELVVHAYRRSFFGAGAGVHAVNLASVRAGNVIGGGDWATDRLVPDIARALAAGAPVPLRNPASVRPWQHVLDALSGYLWLSARIVGGEGAALSEGWNFGPDEGDPSGRITVRQVAELAIHAWGPMNGRLGTWEDRSDPSAPAEALHLGLSIEKARTRLNWRPTWSAREAIEATMAWYRGVMVEGRDPLTESLAQLREYQALAASRRVAWAGPSRGR
jgi:CDP-glucose 4,6-dehydratase